MLKIKVCYAQQSGAECIDIEIAEGSSVIDAINASGIVEKCSVFLEECKLGIYAKFVEVDTLLKDGDRVEIYPPATAKSKRKLGLTD
jgi:putative ubiquitin-RnfH superfamily antitoxin RatB of RatAB toxin-antitoxin module